MSQRITYRLALFLGLLSSRNNIGLDNRGSRGLNLGSRSFNSLVEEKQRSGTK